MSFCDCMSEDLSKEDIDVEIDDVDKNGDNSIVVVPTVKDRIVFYLMGNGDKALEGLQFNEWIHLVILLFCFVFIGLPTSFLLVYTNDLQDSYGFIQNGVLQYFLLLHLLLLNTE